MLYLTQLVTPADLAMVMCQERTRDVAAELLNAYKDIISAVKQKDGFESAVTFLCALHVVELGLRRCAKGGV